MSDAHLRPAAQRQSPGASPALATLWQAREARGAGRHTQFPLPFGSLSVIQLAWFQSFTPPAGCRACSPSQGWDPLAPAWAVGQGAWGLVYIVACEAAPSGGLGNKGCNLTPLGPKTRDGVHIAPINKHDFKRLLLLATPTRIAPCIAFSLSNGTPHVHFIF